MSQILLHGCIDGGVSMLTSANNSNKHVIHRKIVRKALCITNSQRLANICNILMKVDPKKLPETKVQVFSRVSYQTTNPGVCEHEG